MKHAIAVMSGITVAVSLIVVSRGASAEPVLMLNEPRDVIAAKYSCEWAENEIKADQYLIKAFQCSESEFCQRAVDINAACKVSGPVVVTHAFHSKLLAQFTSNAKCAIAIMRLSDDRSDDLETYKRADWELNLSSPPGLQSRGGLCGPANPAR